MTLIADTPPGRRVSVTEANVRGVAGLVKDAESGEDIIVERHGRAVVAVISVDHLTELHAMGADLIAAALVLAREFTDSGRRTHLDDAIAALGFDRAERGRARLRHRRRPRMTLSRRRVASPRQCPATRLAGDLVAGGMVRCA